MARKKAQPKPMSTLRFEFIDSLENVCQQAVMLLQAVDMVLKHSTNIPDGVKEVLAERSKAMRDALISNDEGE